MFTICCLLGYEGKFCEDQYNACDSLVCHNGGSCVIAHDGRAHCSCPAGYVGLHCEEELTGCDSSPCVHGICVDQTHGYRCFCQPGNPTNTPLCFVSVQHETKNQLYRFIQCSLKIGRSLMALLRSLIKYCEAILISFFCFSSSCTVISTASSKSPS